MLLSIGALGTNLITSSIKLRNFSFSKMHFKLSSAKWLPFSPGGDELMYPHKRSLGHQLTLLYPSTRYHWNMYTLLQWCKITPTVLKCKSCNVIGHTAKITAAIFLVAFPVSCQNYHRPYSAKVRHRYQSAREMFLLQQKQ